MSIASVSAYMNSFITDSVSIQLIYLIPLAIGVLGGVAVVRFMINNARAITHI